MATKKQKHAIALAKREKVMAELKASGLEAQKRDKSYRELERQQITAVGKEMNERFNNILAAARSSRINIVETLDGADKDAIRRRDESTLARHGIFVAN